MAKPAFVGGKTKRVITNHRHRLSRRTSTAGHRPAPYNIALVYDTQTKMRRTMNKKITVLIDFIG